MYCNKCGEPLVAGANYCVVCGTAKKGAVRRAAVVPGIVICVVLALAWLACFTTMLVYFVRGSVQSVHEGYQNERFDWQFRLPEGWAFLSEEEMQELSASQARSYFLHEFAAYQTDGEGQLSVSILGLDQTLVSDRELAGILFASDEEGKILSVGERTSEGDEIAAVNETVTIAGEEYGCVTLITNEPDAMYISYYVRVVDDVAGIIVHMYPAQEQAQAAVIRNAFEKWEG